MGTAYDLPDFQPRGSFCCKNNSDVRSILDVKGDGMFVTGGAHSDVIVWKWTGHNQASSVMQGAAPLTSSPFGTAPAVVSSPFANTVSSPFAGGGGMMS